MCQKQTLFRVHGKIAAKEIGLLTDSKRCIIYLYTQNSGRNMERLIVLYIVQCFLRGTVNLILINILYLFFNLAVAIKCIIRISISDTCCASCPAGWGAHQNKCYKVYPLNKGSYNAATAFCGGRGAVLFCPDNSTEMNYVKNLYVYNC